MAVTFADDAPAPTDETTHHELIVIAAGVRGIYQLYRLRQIDADVLVLERNADVGGTAGTGATTCCPRSG